MMGSSSTNNDCTWIDTASSETIYFDDMIDWNWELDSEEQPRPLFHQKRVKGSKYDGVKPPKGIGFVRTFKGFKYPVGRKNL